MNVLKIMRCSNQEIADYAQTKIDNIKNEIAFCESDSGFEYRYKLTNLYKQLEKVRNDQSKHLYQDDEEEEATSSTESLSSKAWRLAKIIANV